MKISEVTGTEVEPEMEIDPRERLKPKKPVGTSGTTGTSGSIGTSTNQAQEKPMAAPKGYGMGQDKTIIDKAETDDTEVGTNNLKTPDFIKNRRNA